ncbi:MAG: hypothetical protein GY953_44055, partial [bacterium]|nr:hypothetical protein [bacterium]
MPIQGNIALEDLAGAGVSDEMKEAVSGASQGDCVSWGIPFKVGRPLLLKDTPAEEKTPGLKAGWLVFLHTCDFEPLKEDERGFISPMRGEGYLGERIAEYVIVYADGAEARSEVRRRHHVGMFRPRWGENCFQAVPHKKPYPVRQVQEQTSMLVDVGNDLGWGKAETRAMLDDRGTWVNWLWAWENPHPDKEIAALRFEPKAGATLLSGIAAGTAVSEPLRWRPRRKAVLRLPDGVQFNERVDGKGRLSQIQLDMGQVISAEPRMIYPTSDWEETYNNRVPEISDTEVLIEYSAHPDARFHFWDGNSIPVSKVESNGAGSLLVPVPSATRQVQVRVIEKATGKPVPVKLHVHGERGEYLPPVDRHRQPNSAWFEDYSPEFQHQARHRCVYMSGETLVDLPLGTVYLEVSKGFEIRPVRKTVQVSEATEKIEITIEKVLPWRERGWVTADTHVHFLSPATARLEGSAEGVNVVNLLASQWSELMTN